MPVRVSVIIPVFQPGPAFDELIESLDQQTLPQEDFEVLLCDDGSGDATSERLESVARTRANVRVFLLPPSGWPGTPRNHGITEARGTYVQFVDQDDRLFETALEKLCDYADLHDSDVIIGREVGIGRPLPRQIFRRDIPHAVLGQDPILELLTPHKMFRTSFLREHGIRFPEGRVRLEDHLFVMEAYFRARTISILASTPVYAWIKHPSSASSSRIDPESYFPHLEAVLDLVEANTEPGTLRDRLLRHWFRGKILKRLSGRQMRGYPDAYRERLLDVVTPLSNRRFGPGVDAGLAFPHRVRAALLRADRRDDLLRFAEFEHELECRVEVTSATWTNGGGLRLTTAVRLTQDGEDALVFEPSDAQPKGAFWRAPAWLSDVPREALDARRDIRSDHVEVLLRDGDTSDERAIARRTLTRRGTVSIALDPMKVFPRGDDTRRAALSAHIRRAGWSFDTGMTANAAVLATAGRSPLLAGRSVRLALNADGVVELRRSSSGAWKDLIARGARRARSLRRGK